MIRIVVQIADASMAANVGGPVQTWFRTFDIEAPELEALLRERANQYRESHVVGVELLSEEAQS